MTQAEDATQAINDYFDHFDLEQFIEDSRKSNPDLLLMMGIYVPENAGGFRPLPIADWLDGLASERAETQRLAIESQLAG